MIFSQSQDKEMNMFGEQLLEFCSMCECVIVNGLTGFDCDDSCTYIRKSEASVDYLLMSCEMLPFLMIDRLETKDVVESDHLPVELAIM